MYTFLEATFKEAQLRGLLMFTCQKECSCCGDRRRFRLASTYVCWTCFGGEDYLSKPKVTVGTVTKKIRKREQFVQKAKNTLGGIPKVYGANIR